MDITPELILFASSVIVQATILILVYKFRDLIWLGLLLRSELSRRGYLKVDRKKMGEIITRLENLNLKIKAAGFYKPPKKRPSQNDRGNPGDIQ